MVLKTSIALNIDKQSFFRILREHIDFNAQFYYPSSSKYFIGSMLENGFRVMVSNTYGTKPVIHGCVQQSSTGITIVFKTKTLPIVKYVLYLMAVVLVFLCGLAFYEGFVLAGILIPIGFTGFGACILWVSYHSELSEAIRIIRVIVEKEKHSFSNPSTNP